VGEDLGLVAGDPNAGAEATGGLILGFENAGDGLHQGWEQIGFEVRGGRRGRLGRESKKCEKGMEGDWRHFGHADGARI
jgi:hypothetical protein